MTLVYLVVTVNQITIDECFFYPCVEFLSHNPITFLFA